MKAIIISVLMFFMVPQASSNEEAILSFFGIEEAEGNRTVSFAYGTFHPVYIESPDFVTTDTEEGVWYVTYPNTGERCKLANVVIDFNSKSLSAQSCAGIQKKYRLRIGLRTKTKKTFAFAP